MNAQPQTCQLYILKDFRMSKPAQPPRPIIVLPLELIDGRLIRDATGRLIGLPAYVDLAIECINMVHEIAEHGMRDHMSYERAQAIITRIQGGQS